MKPPWGASKRVMKMPPPPTARLRPALKPPPPPPVEVVWVIWMPGDIHPSSPRLEITLSPGSSWTSSTGSVVPLTTPFIASSFGGRRARDVPTGVPDSCRIGYGSGCLSQTRLLGGREVRSAGHPCRFGPACATADGRRSPHLPVTGSPPDRQAGGTRAVAAEGSTTATSAPDRGERRTHP